MKDNIMANKTSTKTTKKAPTKASQIVKMLENGKTNEAILNKVETTLNSVRWYRSKFNKGAFA